MCHINALHISPRPDCLMSKNYFSESGLKNEGKILIITVSLSIKLLQAVHYYLKTYTVLTCG